MDEKKKILIAMIIVILTLISLTMYGNIKFISNNKNYKENSNKLETNEQEKDNSIVDKENTTNSNNEVIENDTLIEEKEQQSQEKVQVTTRPQQNNNSNANSSNNNSSSSTNNTTVTTPNTNTEVEEEKNNQEEVEDKNEEIQQAPPQEQEPQKEVIDAIKQYDCGDLYTLSGTKCVYKLSSHALSKFVCSSGALNGSVCETQMKIPKTKQALESCANMGLSGGGHCHSVGCSSIGGIYSEIDDKNNTIYWCYVWETSQVNATTEYYCPSGYTLEGENCTKYYETDAPFTLTCPSGYTLNGIYCEK